MTKSTQSRLPLVLLALGALGCAGCTMHGKWALVELDPDTARRDFEFTSLTLQEDGSFYAEANEPGGIDTAAGTYTYEDELLTLRAHDGESHTYKAQLVSSGRQLRLVQPWEGRNVYATFERAK